MKKILFAFVAVLLSVSSFANPLANPSQDGLTCPADAPCYYKGNAWPCTDSNPTYSMPDNSAKEIKVVKQQGEFIAIVIRSGNAYYVYKHKNGRYTHYFIKNGIRYYFKLNV